MPGDANVTPTGNLERAMLIPIKCSACNRIFEVEPDKASSVLPRHTMATGPAAGAECRWTYGEVLIGDERLAWERRRPFR